MDDATLILLCTTATTLDDQSAALADTTDNLPPGDPGIASAYDAAFGLREGCRKLMVEVASVPASTIAGLQAKATLALREVCSDDERHMPVALAVLRQIADGGKIHSS